MNITPELRRLLDKEIPVLTTEIRALFTAFDTKFHLTGANVPIEFTYREDQLGAYTRGDSSEEEHFSFSLLFIGHALPNPMTREDRLDLFKHEYAHYMQYNMAIPKEYTWQHGTHGSAWKYCCSLTGAAPTPYYKVGDGLKTYDYDALMTKKKASHPSMGIFRQEKAYRDQKNSIAQYKVGDTVEHPKFGQGIVEAIEKQPASVRLRIRFGEDVKAIDQKWLHKSKFQRQGDRR